ncbi:hypothetical protein [Nitrospina gracilis]|uniref:hypothetical protein n=1 Tax=Nitrospina gracilis TaxID=35801 RepID=UPI001F3B5FA3|nr:hypothetical protein [Nitrospina gracilis]MCF8720934.1 hypothetical protein [Nitrospina gracilis Nb-211]
MKNSLLIIPLLSILIGCATKGVHPPERVSWVTPEKIKEQAEVDKLLDSEKGAEQEKADTKPVEVPLIKGGLGYSFDLLYKDLNLIEYKVPGEIEKFGEVTKVQKDDFFPFVTLNFGPLTGRLYSVTGVKLYSLQISQGPLPCLDDFSIVLKAIETKYPALNRYLPFKGDENFKGIGFAPRFYFNYGAYSRKTPRGNYVEVMCGKHQSNRPALVIQYFNEGYKKLYESEKKVFREDNQDAILKQKGIDLDHL